MYKNIRFRYLCNVDVKVVGVGHTYLVLTSQNLTSGYESINQLLLPQLL